MILTSCIIHGTEKKVRLFVREGFVDKDGNGNITVLDAILRECSSQGKRTVDIFLDGASGLFCLNKCESACV